MRGWRRFASAVGEARLLEILGGLMIAMGVLRIVLWEGRTGLSDVVATDLLIVLPGVVLLYGGYRLPDTDLRSDVHPVIVARCLAGIGVMLGVVGVLAISTGLNRPLFTPMAGAALGSVAGFGIGLNEARALSRAYEAEQHRDELRRERDLREQIFETSPIGIVAVDSDGSVKMANQHAARITGLSESELEALDNYDDPMFAATDAEGNPVEGGLVQEILTTGEPVYDAERRIDRSDGQRIWLSVNGAPLRDAAGETTAVVIAFEDVTERRHLERELKEAVDRLEESNERLEQFAYAASHDLQEPLRMVSSYLQLLERRYADDLDEDAREFIDFAVDGADRMRSMIESLLEYSRVETRGNDFEPVDLDAVLADVRDDLQVRIEEDDAQITAESLPRVGGDEEQLRQVFQNLLDNAIEYSGDEPTRVDISAERSGDEWIISVSDDGIGIDPDDADRVFEVFQSLHANGDHPGTGIGLALCERIVERHGGEIWVESTPGEGSTFYFTIPASADRQSESVGHASTHEGE